MATVDLDLDDLVEEGKSRLRQDELRFENAELAEREKEALLQAQCLQGLLRSELPDALYPYLKFGYWYNGETSYGQRPGNMIAMIEVPDWAPIKAHCELTWEWENDGQYVFKRCQIAKANQYNNPINSFEVCGYEAQDVFDSGWQAVLRTEAAYSDIYRALARAEELGNNLEQAEEICRRNNESDAIKRAGQPAASLQDQLVDVLNRFIQAELQRRLGVSCGE